MQQEHEQDDMKYRLKFPLIRLRLLYFILLLSEKYILQHKYSISI